MKIKMFGKKSVSAVLFWFVLLCLGLVLINAIRFIPELIQNKNWSVLPNIAPLISYLALLIPLALILYTFQKKVLFTKQGIKYLYIFAICNLVATSLNSYISVSFFKMRPLETFSLSIPNILLIVFALFLVSIFKQGFQVQQENELTI
ncbi:MAG: hypothetical protein KBT69_06565 [Oceanihabitans sp.]|nr:hypothetical protein [Oceanihabitans sp.]